VSYNLGRAAHRIGLLHVAVAHYERVLQLADDDAAAAAAAGGGAAAAAAAQQLQGLAIQQQQGGGFNGMQFGGAAGQQQQQQQGLAELQKLSRGLAHEAAHNLVLIYRGSGAHDLAGHVMRTYLTF
jgi:general transcription factor 3C polypeptide 3 (transcription factor C subunit 4)